MILKRVLECALILGCLTLAACGESPEDAANSPADGNRPKPSASSKASVEGSSLAQPPSRPLNDWGKALDDIAKIKLTGASTASAKVSSIVSKIKTARDQLGASELEVSVCDSCPPAGLGQAKEAWKQLDDILTILRAHEAKRVSELNASTISQVQTGLDDARASLEPFSLASVARNSETPPSAASSSASPASSPTEGDWDWLVFPAKILGAVILLVILTAIWLALRKRSWARFDAHLNDALTAHIGVVRKQQTDITKQVSTLASAQGELSTRMGDIQTEVRSLGRLIRDASLDSGARRASSFADSYPPTDPPPPRDEPVFPSSTADYLGKMQRMSLVIKPDFQNGILVTDPDGKGELALIRDPKVDDDMQSLFVVPRAVTFQTKQDFYTYYEKYYDCFRPSAGEVWIVEPAIVSKVQGGWQLRKKGVLEIR